MSLVPRHEPVLRALTLFGLALAACRPAPPGRVGPDATTEAELAARQAVAAEQSIRADTLPVRSLGVVPFSVGAVDTALAPLAYGLADLLMTDLARSAQLRVVDRLRLDALLREVRLVEAGRVDTSTAPRVGRLVGARRLIIGALAGETGDRFGIQARVADVVTGEIRAVVSASASLSDILAAEKELALRLFRELGVNLTPAEQRAVEARPTRNLAALLAYSRGVRYEVEARYDAAATEYQNAIRLDPSFAIAGSRLSDVQTRTGPSSTRTATRTQQRAAQVARATSAAVDRVNGVYVSPIGGSQPTGVLTDPSIGAQTATIIITITTPP
jgi:TolB-like protein